MEFSNINYNLFKSFLAVYETKNLSKASELVHISSSTISHNMKVLEKQLGIRLFIAHPKGVDPTREADELAKVLQTAFVHFKDAENIVKELNSFTTGTVKIGCPSGISTFYFSEVFRKFNKNYPHIKLVFYTASKQELYDMLTKRNIDLRIYFSALSKNDPNYETVSLKTVKNTFFMAKSFADKYNLGTNVTKEDFQKLPLIVPSKSFDYIRVLKQVTGVELHPIIESATSELLCSLVRCGIGVGYCNYDFLNSQDIILKIPGVTLPDSVIKCSYNKNAVNKPAQILIKMLKEFCNA